MKKKKYLLLTLLVLTLALAMIACGKDKKKSSDDDDDDDKTTKTEATAKPGKDDTEDNKTEETQKPEETENTEETQKPEETTEPAPAGDDVTAVLTQAAEALKGLGKVTSCSIGADLDANVTYSGKNVAAKGTVTIDVTVDPAVMKIVIDANAMGQAMKYNVYASKEDGKWYITVDMNGQMMKMDADKAKEGTSAQLDKAFAQIAEADLSKQDTSQLTTILEQYKDKLGGLKVANEGGKIVISGTISEETIKTLVQSLSALNKNLSQVGAMLPAGFGGIDFSFSFDESTKLFDSFGIDLSKLADALTQQTGSVAKLSVKVAYNSVSSIEVPAAQEVDPSALGAE